LLLQVEDVENVRVWEGAEKNSAHMENLVNLL